MGGLICETKMCAGTFVIVMGGELIHEGKRTVDKGGVFVGH